jgi:hypothetical protein
MSVSRYKNGAKLVFLRAVVFNRISLKGQFRFSAAMDFIADFSGHAV